MKYLLLLNTRTTACPRRAPPSTRISRWPQLHLARADLLARLGRTAGAVTAYRAALELEPTAPERAFIARRIRDLGTGLP